MKTRMKKWARYRAQIKKTPEDKFPKRKDFAQVASSSDMATIKQATAAEGTITGKKYTLYEEYARRKRASLIFKLSVVGVAVIAFVIVWFVWVVR